ncbi:MAG: hypothetical protein ACE3L7_03205 [Candidatus Pristimantibacillus sp.]
MILEKRQRSPLYPDSNNILHSRNPDTTAIVRTFAYAVLGYE